MLRFKNANAELRAFSSYLRIRYSIILDIPIAILYQVITLPSDLNAFFE